MAISTIFHDRDDYIEVTVTGDYTLDSGILSINELLNYLQKTNKSNVLADCRSLANLEDFSKGEFEYAETLALGIIEKGLGLKIAYLHAPENYSISVDFAKKVGNHLFWSLRLFKDYGEALQWLREGK